MQDSTPTERVIRLIFYLNHPFGRTLSDCLDAIDIKKSTFHEYKNTIENLGFNVINEHGQYFLDTDSSENKWFSSILHISDEESYLLAKAINKLDVEYSTAQRLKNRLLKIFDIELYTHAIIKEEGKTVTSKLFYAIKAKKQVLLINYHSGNSQTVTNRLVEPYKLSDSLNLVFCYDVEKKEVRQFKIERISDINSTNVDWEFRDKHKIMHVDIFRFPGVLDKEIVIKLNLRARNLLIEEYPLSEKCLIKTQTNEYLLSCKVSSFIAPCRFVLGLWDDVEVQGSNDFKDFINEKIKNINYL